CLQLEDGLVVCSVLAITDRRLRDAEPFGKGLLCEIWIVDYQCNEFRRTGRPVIHRDRRQLEAYIQFPVQLRPWSLDRQCSFFGLEGFECFAGEDERFAV